MGISTGGSISGTGGAPRATMMTAQAPAAPAINRHAIRCRPLMDVTTSSTSNVAANAASAAERCQQRNMRRDQVSEGEHEKATCGRLPT